MPGTETASWLETIGLSHLGETFAKKRIDLDSVHDLDASGMKRLNIAPQDREVLLKEIEKLGEKLVQEQKQGRL